MKKLILLTGVIVMMYAASAFAATTATTVTIGTAISGLSGFNLSKNVVAAYESTATAPSGYYTMATKHTSGDTIYGGISTDTAMYKKPGTAGTALAVGDRPTLPTASTDTVSGWSAM